MMLKHLAAAELVLVPLLLLVGVALAEVPDLKFSDLMLYSDHVFTGTVTASEYKDVPNEHHPEDWINRHWKLDVDVKQVFKTGVTPHENPMPGHDDETIQEGMKVHVMMWKAWKRPHGVVGPQGVRRLPNVGETVSFFTRYLHRDPKLRNMYHDSFPHVEEESELAARETDSIQYGTMPHHQKAYNALTPNGINTEEFLLESQPQEL